MWYFVLICIVIFQGYIIYKQYRIIQLDNKLHELADQCAELAELFRPKDNSLPIKSTGYYKTDENGKLIFVEH